MLLRLFIWRPEEEKPAVFPSSSRISHSGPHSLRNLCNSPAVAVEMKGREEKMDRKTVEKNRRMQMKSLCFKLSSLIPKQEYLSKDIVSQHDHLDQAAAYILKLRDGIERLKRRKELGSGSSRFDQESDQNGGPGFKLPVVEVRHQEPNLEVVLISGLENRFALHEVIGILEEEGAEVVNASFSVVGNKVFYTIHSQAFSSRIGLEAARVSERLQELIR